MSRFVYSDVECNYSSVYGGSEYSGSLIHLDASLLFTVGLL